jgi:hypothetical protein
VTKNERRVKEVFLVMLSRHEELSWNEKKRRYLQTTKITNWMSGQVGFVVKPKTVVGLFEEEGYEFIFEKGGFHHWVKVDT